MCLEIFHLNFPMLRLLLQGFKGQIDYHSRQASSWSFQNHEPFYLFSPPKVKKMFS